MKWQGAYLTPALICLAGLLLFVPFLGGIPLFDWDEVNFAEAAREMLQTGDFTRVYMDYIPFWEKPPLFFWLQAASMTVFGVNEFAARFPNAVCGVLTLLSLYWIGKRLYSNRLGILWVLLYGGSVLPHLYFRSGIIDPWFNLFIFLSLVCLIRSAGDAQRFTWLVSAGILLGLAVLTKGPVACLIVGLVLLIYWIITRFKGRPTFLQALICGLLAVLTFGVWYGIETMHHGPWFFTHFIAYQIELLTTHGAGHSGFPGYHFVVLLFGCFPASVIALPGFFKGGHEQTPMQQMFRRWMILLFCVVLVVFTLVQSKIVHYSSLCYFPLTFLAALVLEKRITAQRGLHTWQKSVLTGIALIYVLAGIALVWIGRNPDVLQSFAQPDVDTSASLSISVHWGLWRAMPVIFLLGFIGVVWFKKVLDMKKAALLCIFSGLFIASAIVCWVGMIQQYSQGPATAFFQSLQGKDVYAVTWGHKSFSPLWDFRKPVPEGFGPDSETVRQGYDPFSDPAVLLSDTTITKPVYVVTKASKAKAFAETFADVKQIGREGGFVFFVKEPGQ